jgi:hypothetical protein
MVIIDASLDELTGATIIITTIISTTDRSRDGDRVSVSRHDPLPMDSARCQLSGVKRTLPGFREMSAYDPKRTSADQTCCGAVHHGASQKSY